MSLLWVSDKLCSTAVMPTTPKRHKHHLNTWPLQTCRDTLLNNYQPLLYLQSVYYSFKSTLKYEYGENKQTRHRKFVRVSLHDWQLRKIKLSYGFSFIEINFNWQRCADCALTNSLCNRHRKTLCYSMIQHAYLPSATAWGIFILCITICVQQNCN